MPERLRLLVRTPHQTVLDAEVSGARVPTATGAVGLRPRQEPISLVVEPGLVILGTAGGPRFAATAGGLLEGGRARAVLHTPFAVVGGAEAEVMAALDRALAAPDGELDVRRRLGELERRIVRELRHRPSVARARGAHD